MDTVMLGRGDSKEKYALMRIGNNQCGPMSIHAAKELDAGTHWDVVASIVNPSDGQVTPDTLASLQEIRNRVVAESFKSHPTLKPNNKGTPYIETALSSHVALRMCVECRGSVVTRVVKHKSLVLR